MKEEDLSITTFMEAGGLNPLCQITIMHYPTGKTVHGGSRQGEFKLKQYLMDKLKRMLGE